MRVQRSHWWLWLRIKLWGSVSSVLFTVSKPSHEQLILTQEKVLCEVGTAQPGRMLNTWVGQSQKETDKEAGTATRTAEKGTEGKSLQRTPWMSGLRKWRMILQGGGKGQQGDGIHGLELVPISERCLLWDLGQANELIGASVFLSMK